MKSKQLSLKEMWKLYGILKLGISNSEEYLIDEIFEILNKISKEAFLESLLLLYPEIEFAKHNPVEMATLFISGLKMNNFFAFAEVVQGMIDGNPRRR